MFTTVGDVIIGGAQNIIASGVWALVQITLQVRVWGRVGWGVFFKEGHWSEN